MIETSEKATLNSDTYQCAGCGAALKYKPGTSYLICNYCSTETPIDIEIVEDAIELDFEKYVQEFEDINKEATKVISCQKCGAESTFDESLKSMQCPYCTSPLIESDIHEERLIKPSYLLPFHVSDAEVDNHLALWLKKLWFAPNKLKKRALHTNKLQGVYIPCWTYDALTNTNYTGERGDHYTVTVGSGKDRRTETRTRWRYASGHITLFFDDVMVPASKLIPSNIMKKIYGWDTKNLVESDNRFLSGFITEKYMINLSDGFQYAKDEMESQIRTAIRRDIGGDEQRIHSTDTRYSNITFKLIMLPVYMSSYMYHNKIYHFFVNGRTGKITGNRPYSVAKITTAVILGLIALFLIVKFILAN
mgnify:CR=1 FL=1